MKLEMNDGIKAAIWNATASDEEMTATHGTVGSTDEWGCDVNHDTIRRAAREVIISWAAGLPVDSGIPTDDRVKALLS